MTLILLIGLSMAAQAKGPASAILTGPGIEEPVELINESKSFDTYENDAPIRLIGLTGLWYGPRTETTTPPKDLGPAFTLTWVNSGPPGDPIEERTIYQYMYLDAVGGPVIHTPEQIGLDGWGPEVIGWFVAPEELAGTIDEVIAWSTTEEAAALQPVTESPARSPAAPTPQGALPPLWLVMAATLGISGLVAWQVRRSRST